MQPNSPDLPSFIQRLNDKQQEAALITEGPLIVLAGAGSGKTSMVTSRIAYLVGILKVPPDHVMAVTFTNKAAAEMRERVLKALDSNESFYRGIREPEIGTFHSFCVRLLRQQREATPFTKSFVIFDDSDQLSLIKSVLTQLGMDPKVNSPKSFQAAINRMKCDAIEPEDMSPDPMNPREKLIKEVYTKYQKDLFANNALDFGEIICLTYRLLRDREDIRKYYQGKYRYIHVDEYQDTNRAQYLLLSTLAGPTFGGHQNICVVGDEDQSIYKWRGADIQNILNFEKDFHGAKVVKLEQNYRSTQTIITAASHVISNNRQRKDKRLWTENPAGSPIARWQLPDERMEAESVVREIKRLASDDGRSFDEFSIFYRTHAQSRQFEDILRREKITYQIVGGLKFYERKEIKDILSYFRVILNPEDSISLKRILNVPARGIGKTTVDKLDQLVYEQNYPNHWSALIELASGNSPLSARATEKLNGFVQLIQKCAMEQPSILLSELYHKILDETGYVTELKKEGTIEAQARIENLEEFDNLLQEFEEDFFEKIPEAERETAKPDLLVRFLEQTSLATDSDEPFEASKVRMMTLHSSKGLEFPIVFMVGMEEGLFPSTRPWEETDEEELEEERRLCYVGMTRAREKLYLTHAGVRRIWGQIHYHEPARFLAEIPMDLLEIQDFQFQRSAFSAPSFRPAPSMHVPPRSYSTQVSAYPSEEDSLVGRRIQHPEYGAGVILSIDGGGNDSKAVIEFGARVRRKFLLRFISQYLS